MRFITIPGTTLNASQVCLGTGNFGTGVAEADAFALLDAFVEAGGNFVDSARIYASWLPGGANASERTVGNWLRERKNRDRIIVATKGAHPELSSMHIARMSHQEIEHDIHASLKYLQTDVIDVYWLHRDDVQRPVEEILDSLNAQVQAGRIRYFGCSNWTVPRIQAAADYAQASGLHGFIANQPQWSMATPNRDTIGDKTLAIMDEETLAFHRESGMPVIPYTSQARGFFSKLAQGRLKEADTRQYDNPTNRTRFAKAQALAQQHNVTITAIALSYLTSQPFPVIPIIGAKNFDQLNDSLQHIDFRLTPQELDDLSAS
ncbi:MAG: aldo/keto reductase [Anaerolineae bacterium]|nr:aldo/keto reductase [Anaerolineae bacterium]